MMGRNALRERSFENYSKTFNTLSALELIIVNLIANIVFITYDISSLYLRAY